MLRLAIFALPMLLAGCQQSGPVTSEAKAAAQSSIAASAANPVVLELYQSQGCSSCPPANLALNALADRSDVIALNFSVTYWDRLGWKDIFGDPAYTQRQYDYAASFGNGNVFTPQVVLNGSRFITGARQGELSRAVAGTKPVSGGPAISTEGSIVSVGKGNGNGVVWLVRYDPRVQNVAVKSGENSGRTLPHKNIVRQLSRLGDWSGKATNYSAPKAGSDQWRSVVLVQRGPAGPMIAARKL